MRIFEDAASMSHSSVAIPMLGTGLRDYAKEDVVMDVVWSVEMYNTSNAFSCQSLKKVFLVVESNDKESQRAVENYLPDNFCTCADSKSVKVTFLGIRHEDLTNAVSILTRCLNEQTSNERGLSFIFLSVFELNFMKPVSNVLGLLHPTQCPYFILCHLVVPMYKYCVVT